MILLTLLFACVSQGRIILGDTAVEVDTNTDTDMDTDTEEPEPEPEPESESESEPSPPALESLDLTELDDELVQVTFTVTDADGDAAFLQFNAFGGVQMLAIPGDLATWDGTTGTFVLPFPDICWHGRDFYILEAMVTDASGLESEMLEDKMLTLSGQSVRVTETGDEMSWAQSYDIGSLLTGDLWICGDIRETYPVEATWMYMAAYPADADWMVFEGPVSGPERWRFDLTWENVTADYDLNLMFGYAGGMSYVGVGHDHTGMQPESFTQDLSTGTGIFYLNVRGWSGPGGPWTLKITPL